MSALPPTVAGSQQVSRTAGVGPTAVHPVSCGNRLQWVESSPLPRLLRGGCIALKAEVRPTALGLPHPDQFRTFALSTPPILFKSGAHRQNTRSAHLFSKRGIHGVAPFLEYFSGREKGLLLRGATSQTASPSNFASSILDNCSGIVFKYRHWCVVGDKAHQVTPVAMNRSSLPSPKKSQLPSCAIGSAPNTLLGRTSMGLVILSPKPQ